MGAHGRAWANTGGPGRARANKGRHGRALPAPLESRYGSGRAPIEHDKRVAGQGEAGRSGRPSIPPHAHSTRARRPSLEQAHAHCTTALPAGCSSAGTLTHTGHAASAHTHTLPGHRYGRGAAPGGASGRAIQAPRAGRAPMGSQRGTPSPPAAHWATVSVGGPPAHLLSRCVCVPPRDPRAGPRAGQGEVGDGRAGRRATCKRALRSCGDGGTARTPSAVRAGHLAGVQCQCWPGAARPPLLSQGGW